MSLDIILGLHPKHPWIISKDIYPWIFINEFSTLKKYPLFGGLVMGHPLLELLGEITATNVCFLFPSSKGAEVSLMA